MIIKLGTITDIKNFIRKVVQHKGNVFACSGCYKVDAKSLMALLSLDLEQPFVIESDREEAKLFEELKQWAA